MPKPSPAAERFKLSDTKHNLLTQIADFVWICASLSIVVSLYPAATHSVAIHSSVAAFAGLLFFLVGSAQRLYQTPWLRRSVSAEVRAVCVCWAWVLGPLFTLGFATKVLSHFSRVAIVSWIAMAPLLIVLCRGVARASLRAGRTARRAAIAGISAFGEQIFNTIQNTPALGLSVVGVFDDRSSARQEPIQTTLRNAGTFGQLVAAAREGAIDVIYIALPLRAELRVKDLILRLQDTTASVYVAFDFGSLAGDGYQQLSYVGNLPVVPLLAGRGPSVRRQALDLVRAVRGESPRGFAAGASASPLSTASCDSGIDRRDGPGAVG